MKRPFVFLSPVVVAMLSLRMDAAHGTPTIFEKIGALLGLGGTDQAATLAGDEHDLSTVETDFLNTFLQPLLHTVESDGLTDLSALVTTTLASAAGGQVPSVAAAVDLVKTAVTAQGGSLLQQIEKLGETSLVTLVSAGLASLGHTALPAA